MSEHRGVSFQVFARPPQTGWIEFICDQHVIELPVECLGASIFVVVRFELLLAICPNAPLCSYETTLLILLHQRKIDSLPLATPRHRMEPWHFVKPAADEHLDFAVRRNALNNGCQD